MSQDISHASSTPASADATHSHRGGSFWILALGSVGVVFGDIGTSPLYALQTALGQFTGGALRADRGHRHRLAHHLGAADRRHGEIRAFSDDGGQQGRRRHSFAQRAGPDGARQQVENRLPARRRGRGAVFRRRDHHAGDLGAISARGPEAGQSRPRDLCAARDDRHSGHAVSWRKAGERRGSRRSSARSCWCFFAVIAVLGLLPIPSRRPS